MSYRCVSHSRLSGRLCGCPTRDLGVLVYDGAGKELDYKLRDFEDKRNAKQGLRLHLTPSTVPFSCLVSFLFHFIFGSHHVLVHLEDARTFAMLLSLPPTTSADGHMARPSLMRDQGDTSGLSECVIGCSLVFRDWPWSFASSAPFQPGSKRSESVVDQMLSPVLQTHFISSVSA